MDLFDIAVAKKLAGGGGGGGGGSSDFSTATVTITLNDGTKEYLEYYNPIYWEADEYDEGFPALASVNMDAVAPHATNVVPIILYKGYGLMIFADPIKNSTTLSGDCEFPGEYGNMLLIWGDCTITIS